MQSQKLDLNYPYQLIDRKLMDKNLKETLLEFSGIRLINQIKQI